MANDNDEDSQDTEGWRAGRGNKVDQDEVYSLPRLPIPSLGQTYTMPDYIIVDPSGIPQEELHDWRIVPQRRHDEADPSPELAVPGHVDPKTGRIPYKEPGPTIFPPTNPTMRQDSPLEDIPDSHSQEHWNSGEYGTQRNWRNSLQPINYKSSQSKIHIINRCIIT